MEVFKNSVGRPSNETLKKRRNIKILIAILIIAIVGSGIFLASNAFGKNDILGIGKNASTGVSIEFYNFDPSATKDKTQILAQYGKTVKFNHKISNANGYYTKWFVYTNNKETNQSKKCEKITNIKGKNYYDESDSLNAQPGATKYIKVIVYSDSSCKKEVKRADSPKAQWPTQAGYGYDDDKTLVSIKIEGYNTTNPTKGQKVTFKHTINNGAGYYQKWYVYTDGKITSQGNCEKITSNSHFENDSLTAKEGSTKYLKIAVYTDKTCSKETISQKSYSVKWPGTGSGTSSNIGITFSGYSSTTPQTGTKVTFKHSITNANGYYQRWFTITNGTQTGSGSCTKLTTNTYNESDAMTGTNGQQKYLKVVVYSDNKCTKSVITQNSKTITWGSGSSGSGSSGSGTTTTPLSVSLKCYKNGITLKEIESASEFYCMPTSSQYNSSKTTYTYKVTNSEDRSFRVNSTITKKTGSLPITQASDGTKSYDRKQYFYVYGKAGTTVTVTVTMKNKDVAKSATASYSFKIVDDSTAPYISKACVKYSGGKPYVYIEVADQYKVKQVAWATSASQCKKLTSSAIMSLNVKDFKGNISKVVDTTTGIVACAWDNNNRLNTKSIAKSC